MGLDSFGQSSAGADAQARVETILRSIVAQLEVIQAQMRGRIEPRLLTLDQAAAYIGRSKRGVEYLIKANAFATIRYGDRVHIDRNDLDAWITQNRF